MASRMEKYYQNKVNIDSRTSKNAGLYDEIYDNVKYSNVEGITEIEKSDEIDISKIKEFIRKYEDEKNQEQKLIKRVVIESANNLEEDEKQYDLKELIALAKKERPKEEKDRYIRNFKSVSLEDKINEMKDDKKMKGDVVDLSILGDLGDCELSLDLLDSLKSDDNTFIEELPNRKIEEFEQNEMDSSFYTSSMKFSKDDFEELEDIDKNLKKNNAWITLLVFIILVIIITACLFLFKNVF